MEVDGVSRATLLCVASQRRLLLALLVATVVLAAGASEVDAAAPGRHGVSVRVAVEADPWAKLRRPLHIPRIAPGARCPVTPVSATTLDRAQGPGPVYPIGGFPALLFNYPPQPDQITYGSRWSGQKVLWLGRASYHGRVLIRGRQLDGSHELRFGLRLHPPLELRLESFGPVGPSGWRDWPSTTRIQAAGCYAWQVDGSTFSRVIVFRAVRISLH